MAGTTLKSAGVEHPFFFIVRVQAYTASVAVADLPGIIAAGILNTASGAAPDVALQRLAATEDGRARAATASGEIKVIRERGGYEDSVLTDEEFAAGVVEMREVRSYVESRGGAVVELPLHIGDMRLWKLWDAVDELALECGLPTGTRMAYRARADEDAKAAKLVVRDLLTGASCEAYAIPHLVDYTTDLDMNDWLENELKVDFRLRGIAAETAAAGTQTSDAKPRGRRRRRDMLTPVVEEAQGRCKDPMDWTQVWAQLAHLAEKQHPPLFGSTEEGIQYLHDGEAQVLSKEALRKRLGRARKL